MKNLKRAQLRTAARLALTERYPGVAVVQSQGVASGAQLSFVFDGRTRQAAIRTSKERKVGLLRSQSGRWRTVSSPLVELILVAVPSKQGQSKPIEVLAYNAQQFVAEFDKYSQGMQTGNEDGPLFLWLDRALKPGKRKVLSVEPQWRQTVDLPAEDESNEQSSQEIKNALEIIRSSIARGLQVSPRQINLSFQFSIAEEPQNKDGEAE